MGVYHLMGLGRSVGVITGPVSYLAHRYQRWNSEDQDFFGSSGEASQRHRGEKVGDIQAIVLFSSPEVIDGYDPETKKECLAYGYIDNRPGTTQGRECEGGKMRDLVRKLLPKELKGICGGRPECSLFWCKVDRRNLEETYRRVATVVAALARVGGHGKEMWVNLTGGNNVINLALELAANLSGQVGRIYYVQAQDNVAEKCIRYTGLDGYWVEIPVMPLAISEHHRAILDLLTRQEDALEAEELYSRLVQEHWDLFQAVTKDEFRTRYLEVLWKQGLAAGVGNRWQTTRRWDLIRRYQEVWETAHGNGDTLEALAEKEDWLERELLPIG